MYIYQTKNWSNLVGNNGRLLALLPFILMFCLAFSFSCGRKTEQKQQKSIQEEVLNTIPLPDTIDVNSIHIHAELLYDSISYIVLKNYSALPLVYDASYRFEQKIYGKWKAVKVRQKDTTHIVLQPGDQDTLQMKLSEDIGYQPIGACRVYKTVSTLNGKQEFELLKEADARPQYIDWRRVDLIPDTTQIDSTLVTMTVKLQNRDILISLQNHTDKTIVFGDYTNFSLSVFLNEQWQAITYAKVEHDVAVILDPNGSINNMVHTLPDVNFHFQTGRYRILKSFFFESDYKKKYTAGAEFVLPSNN